MRAAIVQSSFLPWRGYFDMIDDVDVFVFFDDVQYVKKSWRARNRIKTAQGARWIIAPVCKDSPRKAIDETRIDDTRPWRARILAQLDDAYRRAPHFAAVKEGLVGELSAPHETISHVNMALTRWACRQLGISTRFVNARDLGASGVKTERVIELLRALGAGSLVNGPTARAYTDHDLIRHAGIALYYKSYDYPAYPQLHGEFLPDMSIMDLLFNCGPDSRRYLKSLSPSVRAV
ncbi:MAG: WbqC family protein [Alphaproteobacteria bacterium]